MARQDSRHGGPEEIRDAKHAYCLKASTAKVGWPCYIRMPNERLPKKVFYGYIYGKKLQEGKRSQGNVGNLCNPNPSSEIAYPS